MEELKRECFKKKTKRLRFFVSETVNTSNNLSLALFSFLLLFLIISTCKHLLWHGPVNSHGPTQKRLGIRLHDGLGSVVDLIVLDEGAADHLTVGLLEDVHLGQLAILPKCLSHTFLGSLEGEVANDKSSLSRVGPGHLLRVAATHIRLFCVRGRAQFKLIVPYEKIFFIFEPRKKLSSIEEEDKGHSPKYNDVFRALSESSRIAKVTNPTVGLLSSLAKSSKG